MIDVIGRGDDLGWRVKRRVVRSGTSRAKCCKNRRVTTGPDLSRVVTAWPDLPAHIKAAVLALVGTAR
jgi:hypothetical protein